MRGGIRVRDGFKVWVGAEALTMGATKYTVLATFYISSCVWSNLAIRVQCAHAHISRHSFPNFILALVPADVCPFAKSPLASPLDTDL